MKLMAWLLVYPRLATRLWVAPPWLVFARSSRPRCASARGLWHERDGESPPAHSAAPCFLDPNSLERSQLKFLRVLIFFSVALAMTGCRSYAERTHGEDLLYPTTVPSSGAEKSPAREDATEGVDEDERERIRFEDLRESSELDLRYPSFGDPVLARLIERGLESSHDIAATLARIRLAWAMADQARAARFPVVSANASALRASVIQGPLGRVETTSFTVSLPIRWELDLYGRFASEHLAAKDMARASELDFEAMRISLAATIAEAYIGLIAVRAERALLDEQLEVNRQYLELVELRYQSGIASAVDVHQQNQQVAALESQRDLLEGQETVSKNAIHLLLGITGESIDLGDRMDFPIIEDAPELSIPLELFERRPDIRAAAMRVEAYDRRVRAAIAAQLPSLRLEFTPGYTAIRAISDFSASLPGGGRDFRTGVQWTAGASMDVAVFDGLLGPAIARARRAEVDEALALYQQLFQSAIVEVENSIALEEQQRRALDNLERQREFAVQMLESSKERYQAGLSDFLPVLTALRTLQQTEQGILNARRNLLTIQVQRYRALGGVIAAQ